MHAQGENLTKKKVYPLLSYCRPLRVLLIGFKLCYIEQSILFWKCTALWSASRLFLKVL